MEHGGVTNLVQPSPLRANGSAEPAQLDDNASANPVLLGSDVVVLEEPNEGPEGLHASTSKASFDPLAVQSRKSRGVVAARKRESLPDVQLEPSELQVLHDLPGVWHWRTIMSFLKGEWLTLGDSECSDDRNACLIEQSNIALLAGLAASVAVTGMTGYDVDDPFAWPGVVNAFLWCTATMSLLLSVMISILVYLGASETNTEGEYHHFEALLGAARMAPFFMLAVGTTSLLFALVAYHAMKFKLEWKPLLLCGGGFGAGIFLLPYFISSALKVCWALRVVHTTGPILESIKEADDITAKDIYDALLKYYDRKQHRFAALNRDEFLHQFRGKLGPTMLKLAGKIWDQWIDDKEHAMLADLGLATGRPMSHDVSREETMHSNDGSQGEGSW